MDAVRSAQVLSGDRGYWSATPSDYSSLRYLHFEPNGTGTVLYGFGQTIYANIKCDWSVIAEDVLQITYREPVKSRLQPDYVLPENERMKQLIFRLTEGEVTGVESIVGHPYRFLWTLELSADPWPNSLDVPRDRPTTFYGYREIQNPAN